MNILVVDDTITYRKILSEVAKQLSDVDEVVTAPSGSVALKKLDQNPFDLVLLDIQMPEMDGLETLEAIRKKHPMTDVVMVSGVTERGASITVKALNMGAVEFVRKPETSDAQASVRELHESLQPIIRLVNTRRFRKNGSATGLETKKTTPQAAPAPARQHMAPTPKRFGVLAIGVSTGGPRALAELIPLLPPDFPLPIVVVQHMPPTFTNALAMDLNRKSALEVKEASEDDIVAKGRVLLAPGGRHMVVRQKDQQIVVGINDGPPENSCRPAVDVLFRSVANCYGSKGILAAILTGMGNDGMRGVQILKRKGCYCLTQSEASCVVYGMPAAVDQAGLSDESPHIQDMAKRISDLARKG
ncbi:MAG: chemotaxis-specific protein-glutamate methyltransferase CheB [Candidatus Sumerlaeia bacterium]